MTPSPNIYVQSSPDRSKDQLIVNGKLVLERPTKRFT